MIKWVLYIECYHKVEGRYVLDVVIKEVDGDSKVTKLKT